MLANRMKKVGLGLGTVAVVGVIWLLTYNSTSAVGSRSNVGPYEGQINRFTIVTPRANVQYLLDTCSGDVWALTDVDSGEDLLQVWVKMYRYDNAEDVKTIFDGGTTKKQEQLP